MGLFSDIALALYKRGVKGPYNINLISGSFKFKGGTIEVVLFGETNRNEEM